MSQTTTVLMHDRHVDHGYVLESHRRSLRSHLQEQNLFPISTRILHTQIQTLIYPLQSPLYVAVYDWRIAPSSTSSTSRRAGINAQRAGCGRPLSSQITVAIITTTLVARINHQPNTAITHHQTTCQATDQYHLSTNIKRKPLKYLHQSPAPKCATK